MTDPEPSGVGTVMDNKLTPCLACDTVTFFRDDNDQPFCAGCKKQLVKGDDDANT